MLKLRFMLPFCLTIGLLSQVAIPFQADAYTYKTSTVTTKSGKHQVNLVELNMSEPVKIIPVIANGRVGKVQELRSMAKDVKALAAINGTFFNPYDQKDLQPQGTIMRNGTYLHVKGSPVLMGITKSNDLVFGNTKDLKIVEKKNGGKDWQDTWYAWSINHTPTAKGEIMIFTPAYRTDKLSLPSFTFITVSKGKVTAKTKGSATIPKGGFVIAYDTVPNN